MNQKPSAAFVAASWLALGAGAIGFFVGLWRATMQLNKKRLLFYRFNIWTFCSGFLTEKCTGQVRETSGYRSLLWYLLVCNTVINCIIDNWFMERNDGIK